MTSEPLDVTPSQTVGPVPRASGCLGPTGRCVVAEGTPGAVRIAAGCSTATGELVPDAHDRDLAGRPGRAVRPPGRPARRLRDRAARVPRLRPLPAPTTTARYAILTVKPGPLPDGDGGLQAPHLDVRCSPAACSTGWSPGSTSPTSRRPTPRTPCCPACRPGAPRDTLVAVPERRRLRPLRHPPAGRRMRPSSSRSEPASSSPYGGLLGALPGDPRSTRSSATGPGCRRCSTSRPRWPRPRPRWAWSRRRRPRRSAGSPAPRDYDAGDAGAPRPPTPATRSCRWSAWLTATRVPDEDAARCVHLGATSQDILDTALMLVAGAALAPLLRRPGRGGRRRCAGWPPPTATTLMAAARWCSRPLPTTFGLKAAGWLTGLDAAAARLRRGRSRLAVQLGGAGRARWRALGPQRPELRTPARRASWGWPSRRCPGTPTGSRSPSWPARWAPPPACAARSRSTSCCWPRPRSPRCARAAPGRGGSSAMPHKRNPVAAMLDPVGAARARPGLVATLLAGRGAGARAGRRRLARRVADAARAAAPGGWRGGLAADVLEGLRVTPRGWREPGRRPPGRRARRGRAARAGRRTGPGRRARRSSRRAARAARAERPPLAEVLRGRRPRRRAPGRRRIEACFDPGRHARVAPGARRPTARPQAPHRRTDDHRAAPRRRRAGRRAGARARQLPRRDPRHVGPAVPALAERLPRGALRPPAATAVAGAGRAVHARRPRSTTCSRCWTPRRERAHFAGLSLGGMVGMWLAAHAPDRVDRLALLLHLGELDRPGLAGPGRGRARAGGTASSPTPCVGRWLTPAFAAAHPDLVAGCER